jgi:hypothetical protein
LCALGIKWHEKVHALTGIGVERGKERRVGDVQIGLVKRDLCRVLGKGLGQAVALELLPAFGTKRFMLPDQRID